MPKLTKTAVDREQPSDKEKFVWDGELKGFGLKVFPTGAKSFVFQYRTAEGQTKRLTIGKHSDSLTVDQARKLAKDLAFRVHAGGDPQREKQDRRAAITVDELLDEYLASESFTAKAKSTRDVDAGRIKWHVRPTVGKLIADKVTKDDVKRMHREVAEGKTAGRFKTGSRGLARVTGGEGTANKAVLILSAAYEWAMDANRHTIKANPAAEAGNDLACWKTGQRDTIVDNASDYQRLFTTLQKMENEKRLRPAAADAIRFIALTGARRGEATGLLWEWVDLKGGRVVIPSRQHKTGRKTAKPRIIALPAEAQAIIARQTAGEPYDYVFRPAKGAGGPISLGKAWPTVRKEAGLPKKLGLHGLRHAIGSHLAMAGASAVELMEALGHKRIDTTLRYIHFAERARSTLAERAAAVATAGLADSIERAHVVPLKKGKTAA